MEKKNKAKQKYEFLGYLYHASSSLRLFKTILATFE